MVTVDWWISQGFYITRIVDIVELNRSTYYDRKFERKPKESKSKRGRPFPGYSMHKKDYRVPDEQIEEYLMELYHDDHLGDLGYKKWTVLLNELHGVIINKKKVYRLCKKLGILQKRREKQPKHPRRLTRNRSEEHTSELQS